MAGALAEIVDNGLCLGCGACVSALGRTDVVMALNEAGYLRPSTGAELSANEHETLKAVCVGESIGHDQRDADYDPLWGPIKRLGTGYATDPEVRHRGSSGGVISAIAIGLVESGEVDFVVTTGPDPKDPIGNDTDARHDRDAILLTAGSRYAPSSPLAGIAGHLATGKRFAFVGKPCDVAALRRMAKRDPRIDVQVPYMIAFFCAGVPSRIGTMKVLEKLGVVYENLVAFRYRGDGWPGLTRASMKNGEAKTMDYNSSWGSVLNRHLQFRCKICPDGTGEFADIACADAWYGADGYPDFAEREGRSLVVVRTEAGKALVASLEEAGRIKVDSLEVAEIAKMQPYQVHRKRHVLARISAMWLLRRKGPHYSGLELGKTTRQASLASQLRDFIGTARRLPPRRKTLQ